MRCLLPWFAALALAAGEATPLPAPAQKLVDDADVAVAKAKQAYDQALDKEQAKLLAALTKEQERETKKGNFDGALAIKALVGEVQAGLLRRRAEAANDLLGEESASKAPLAMTAPADLVIDGQLTAGPARAEGQPAQFAEFMQRAVAIRLPKGEATRYTLAAQTAGMVLVSTGGGERNAELWTALTKAGFHRLDEGGTAWFVLNAKPGDRFTVFDPANTYAPIMVYGLRIRPAR